MLQGQSGEWKMSMSQMHVIAKKSMIMVINSAYV